MLVALALAAEAVEQAAPVDQHCARRPCAPAFSVARWKLDRKGWLHFLATTSFFFLSHWPRLRDA
jgi:hypothetical protein